MCGNTRDTYRYAFVLCNCYLYSCSDLVFSHVNASSSYSAALLVDVSHVHSSVVGHNASDHSYGLLFLSFKIASFRNLE